MDVATVNRLWPGKARFVVVFGRVLIVGPDFSCACFTFVLLNGACTCLAIFVTWRIHLSLLVLGIMLQLLSNAFLFLTSFSDPGFVLPQVLRSVGNVEQRNPTERLCSTCGVVKPERSKHCSLCGGCVRQLDHHCPWVGTCVGLRNYGYFVSFVSTCALLTLFATVCCIVQLATEASQSDDPDGWLSRFFDAAGENPVSTIVLVVALLCSCMVVGLCAYHMSLIRRGVTTNEDIRRLPVRTIHGWRHNMRQVLFVDTQRRSELSEIIRSHDRQADYDEYHRHPTEHTMNVSSAESDAESSHSPNKGKADRTELT